MTTTGSWPPADSSPPTDSLPVDTWPLETWPVDTWPVDTWPVETWPVDTTPPWVEPPLDVTYTGPSAEPGTQHLAGDGVVFDITPDGRYALLADMNGARAVRLDLVSGEVRPVTVRLDGAFLTADGTAVITREPGSDGTLLRYDVGSGATTQAATLPPEWGIVEVTSISSDGRFVGVSAASGYYGDSAAFVLDTVSGSAARLEEHVGNEGSDPAGTPLLSASGDTVAFRSSAAGVGCTTCTHLWALRGGVAEAITVTPSGALSTTGQGQLVDISADGRFVLFTSTATDLVAGFTAPGLRYYVRDLDSGVTELLPIPTSAFSTARAQLSADGRRVIFAYDGDVVISSTGEHFSGPLLASFDRLDATTTPLLLGYDGSPPADGTIWGQRIVADATGRTVSFTASASNLVAGIGAGLHAYVLRLADSTPPPTTTVVVTTVPAVTTVPVVTVPPSSPATTTPDATTPPSTDGVPPVLAGGTIEVAVASPRPGALQTVVAAGFVPGERVTGTQFSTPLALGTEVADANGAVTFSWTIRADETPGRHRVVLVGEWSGSIEVVFEVAATAEPPVQLLPATC